MKALELTGQVFGRLTVLKFNGHLNKRRAWLCQCECGNTTTIRSETLRAGSSRSCGCATIEAARKRSITHGHRINRTATRELKSWEHARQRCFNPHNKKYPAYGGRGITMCEQWRYDFLAFYNYMGDAPAGQTLDRIDVNGNYEPGNCRWATSRQQARNMRQNIWVNCCGVTMILKDFAKHVGLGYSHVHRLVRYKGRKTWEICHRSTQH